MNNMTDSCLKDARKKFKDKFKKDDIDYLYKELKDEKLKAIEANDNLFKKLDEKGEDLLRDISNHEDIQEFHQLHKQAIFADKAEFVLRHKNKAKGLYRSLLSKLSGTESGVKGSRENTNTEIKNAINMFEGELQNKLEKEGLMSIHNSDENQAEKGDAYINNPVENPEIVKYAKIMREYTGKVKDFAKQNGIFIPESDDRIHANMWDRRKLMQPTRKFKDKIKKRFIRGSTGETLGEKALKTLQRIPFEERVEEGYQHFKSIVRPNAQETRLNDWKTFGTDNEQRIDNILRGSFRGMTDDGRITAQTDGSISSRYLRRKVLYFKDGKATAEITKKLGFGNFRENIMTETKGLIRDATVAKHWGDNPSQMISDLWKFGKKQYGTKLEEGSKKEYKFLQGIVSSMRGVEENLGGTFSDIMANLRAFNTVKDLGGVIKAQTLDIPVASEELAKFTGGHANATAILLKRIAKGKTPEEMKILHRQMGIFVEHTSGALQRFSYTDDDPGHVMKTAMRLSNKLNLSAWWHYAMRSEVGSRISNFIAGSKDDKFEALSPENQKTLSLYDIGPDEWDIYRKSATKSIDGNDYITPDGVRTIDEDLIKKYIYKQGFKKATKLRIKKTKDDLEAKLGVYFLDRIDHAILMPDVADTLFWQFGTQKGTFWNDIARSVSQFKSYPTAFIRKPLAKMFYSNGADTILESILTGKADYRALARLTSFLTFLGYIKMSTTDILNNETPPPMSLKVLGKSMIEGGAATIYLESVFSPVKNIFGPGLGDLYDGTKLLKNMFTNKKFPTKEALYYAKNQTPLINLIYVKPIFDYFIWSTALEANDPTYMQKHLRQLRQNGQTTIF